MATQDRSPSLFLGQPWASWADKMSITDGNDDEDDDKSDAKDDGDSMKLNKKDMDLFGFCPYREDFTLALCEICNLLVKPQALKRHIENRHGSVAAVTATLDEQAATSKVLNSELAKTLSLPVTSFGKTSTTNKPPTKASLKQVPSSVRMLGSAAGSSGSGNTSCKVNSSSRPFRKTNTQPVVKMERIPKEVASMKKVITATLSASSSSLKDVMSSLPVSVTAAVVHTNRNTVIAASDSDKSLTNGTMLKKVMGTSQSSVTAISTTPVTTLASQPLALTTTTTSVTYTRPTPATLPTSTATTTFAVLSRTSKPVRTAVLNSALAATLTATHNPLRASALLSSSSSSKSKKSPKERKFLPCKDREFDANKHCGVVMEDTGKPCTRSLTCKTHALGLRRAVPGRKKSFDDLLREHKAAKEALVKAKAEEQAVTAGGLTLVTNPSASAAPTLVTAVSSPAALAAVSAIKLGHPDMSTHRDIKSAASVLASHSSLHRSIKPPRPAVNSVFQKFTAGGSFPPSLTIKEEPSPILDPSGHLAQPSEKEGEMVQEKPDVTYLSHHPRPAAMCTFGARMAGKGCALFSRRTDLVRAAFLSALERQLNPPPHKKLCVESKLPKEPQMSSNSKDPYEFNMVDSGLGHQRQTVSFTIGGPVNTHTGLLGKPLLKHKARSLSSHSLNVSGLAVSSGMSATPTTIAIPTLAAALLKPTKGSEMLSGSSSAGLQRGTLSLPQTSSQSLKRKRGSSQGSGNSSQNMASSTLQLQNTGVGLTVTTGAAMGLAGADGNRTSQQQSAVLTPVSSVNSHSATTPLTAFTIPSVNLANAATLGLSATLPNNKQQGQGQKSNIIKDFNLVLTGLDPLSVPVNGQYVNITGTQLAELAAAQAVSATAEDKNIKRSRLANAKHGMHKIPLETIRALQGNNVLTAMPQNAVLVDGNLQGAVLAPVSSLSGGGGGGGNSTFVALTSSAITSSQSSSITVAPNTIFRTVSESGTPQQMTLTTASFANGIIPSAGDKLHVATGSTHSQQQHRIANNVQGRAGSVSTAKTLQASGLIQAQGTPLCPNPGLTGLAHLKPGTFNITKGGKITMQPVSVTIPLVSPLGLGALNPSQQQNPHPHQQPTLLVTTTADDVRAGGGVAGGGKTEIHLQTQISSASSGVIS